MGLGEVGMHRACMCHVMGMCMCRSVFCSGVNRIVSSLLSVKGFMFIPISLSNSASPSLLAPSVLERETAATLDRRRKGKGRADGRMVISQ